MLRAVSSATRLLFRLYTLRLFGVDSSPAGQPLSSVSSVSKGVARNPQLGLVTDRLELEDAGLLEGLLPREVPGVLKEAEALPRMAMRNVG